MVQTKIMPESIKKAASATILSLLGSSFILAIAIFLVKDTIDRVNVTIANVGKHSEQMVGLDGSVVLLNSKLDTLNTSVNTSSDTLKEYVADHGRSMARVSTSMVRITEKLIALDDKFEGNSGDIGECERKIEKIIYEHLPN